MNFPKQNDNDNNTDNNNKNSKCSGIKTDHTEARI